MPFDLHSFKTRTLSAVVFTIAMLVGLLWNRWAFIILFTVIHFACWYEFIRLVKKIRPVDYRIKSLLGLFYITLPIALLFVMRLSPLPGKSDDFLKIIPCGIVFSIWITDTMAYIVGSLIGKKPLTLISPKKTWEGTIGGIILCIVVISLSGYLSGFYSFLDWFMISLFCSVFGTFGDLLESKLKRMAEVKDSGNLMPGHGGFLDRFDSLLIALPFVFLYYFFFIR